LTAAVIIALYWLVQKAVKTHSLLPILVAFFIGQAFIFSRGWIKVGLQSAQMNFYQLSTPPPKGIDAGSLNDKNPEEQTP
jgi:hypothetical protein